MKCLMRAKAVVVFYIFCYTVLKLMKVVVKVEFELFLFE